MQKFRLTILLIICSNGLAYAQTFNETPILPFMPQKEMKFPKISGLPDIKSTLSETNPVFSNSLPLAKQYELRKRFSYLDPVFTSYFNQEQHRLLNSHYFGYELYGSSYSLRGVGTQNMAGGRLVYHLNKQLTIRIGGNAYQYRSNGRMFNDFTLNADLTYRLNNWLTAYVYGQYRLNCTPNSGVQGFPLSPQSHYGALFRINLLKKKEYGIDLNLGTDRSYNAATRQWENTYRVGPAIRLK
ncbi:hypothetical protein K0E75_07765 [Bacteroides fragilis]|uniref:hypothetical protein n=1 Tax=Bacteroides TaxID=816 RepID=UPI002030584A|nr:hypothetical protein [Bacteroides fragilis]MCE8587425.1 hypothetical protein [Bacteroides fragilis]MCE8591209.1 hypothetical protein [Bacteroides fragilis]MCE8658381.1 hypothetical protein [Bacteroides fragilis]MCE8661084.1 hypothetical protein [Bacteroides fragilis]MCM0262668.1 hypothetical protein [Bacteroides fragilis]